MSDIDYDKAGGCAFPIASDVCGHAGGMTLRDYFAAKAFEMFMHPDSKYYKPEKTAEDAYRFADAMLKERAK
jgi:hypothetical protein